MTAKICHSSIALNSGCRIALQDDEVVLRWVYGRIGGSDRREVKQIRKRLEVGFRNGVRLESVVSCVPHNAGRHKRVFKIGEQQAWFSLSASRTSTPLVVL